jgi:hypothetical protein
MRDEGGGMKRKASKLNQHSFHPSSLILHPFKAATVRGVRACV